MLIKEGQLLERLVKLSPLTAGKIAKEIGISRSQLYNLYKEESITEYYKNCLKKVDIYLDKNTQSNSKGVPVYNVDFTAGDVTQFGDEQQRIIGHIDLNGFRSCIGFVPVKGSSMYPDFVAGDLVGLEPVQDFSIIEYGQPFAIVTKNGQRMIKIIRKGKDDEHLILRSVNKEFDDISLHKNKIEKLFKIHGPIRDTYQ